MDERTERDRFIHVGQCLLTFRHKSLSRYVLHGSHNAPVGHVTWTHLALDHVEALRLRIGHPAKSPSVRSVIAQSRPHQPVEGGRPHPASRREEQLHRAQDAFAGIGGLVAKLLLDTDQLVVFGQTVGPRQRAGFDLPAVGRNREVSDGAVFCFP